MEQAKSSTQFEAIQSRASQTRFDGDVLAEAFPSELRGLARLVGAEASRRLYLRYTSERFTVQIGEEKVLIPARLHFRSERSTFAKGTAAWRLARALQTRSTDGYERQRALRDMLTGLEVWETPFVMALLGEYVVEILDDIMAAMHSDLERTMCAFIVANPSYWRLTKQRVASYWDVYYRDRDRNREEYVGFRLVRQLEFGCKQYKRTLAP